MNKTITLIAFYLFFSDSLFSQIDPFSDFKKNTTWESTTNVYFIQAADSIDIATTFDAVCNPLKTIKSKWFFNEKKIFYQEKDSFSYTTVGNIVRPVAKTSSIWHFKKQAWVEQTRLNFNYPDNNPNFVERTTSVFDTLKQQWFKRSAERFSLDRKGNTLTYENYDPLSTSKNVFYKMTYAYTTWGALTLFKSEQPSNEGWRTDSLKTITYDAYRNKTSSILKTYNYDKSDNLLSENAQKDSTIYTYSNGLLTYRKTRDKYPLIDSFFYDAEKVLILTKNFKTNLLGSIDTSVANSTIYSNIDGESLIQKKVFKRILKRLNPTTKRDTSYWITSFTEFYTHNALNKLATFRFVSSDPQYDYVINYSKISYKYCVESSTPTNEIKEDLAFKISPNPTNQTLFIAFEGQTDRKSTIQILDVLGNTLKWINQDDNDSRQIDVSDFVAGVYFLKVQMGNKIGVKKFVVNR